jgi:hypothetical protein
VWSARWSLHDVADMEALAAHALDEQLRAWRAWLPEDESEDLLQHLLGLAWKLALKYDPARGWSFSSA